MTREQVIKGLECRKNAEMRCGNPCEETGNCKYATLIRDPSGEPYYPYVCDRKRLCEDAIALLKEQEVIPHKNYAALDLWWCGCGWCIGKRGTFNYCPNCGKAVKWE